MPAETVHSSGMATSTALAGYFVVNFIPPLDVIRVLNRAKIHFVLLGIHGLVGWLAEPRAAQSVDVLVSARSHEKVKKTLLVHFPNLVSDRDVTQLRDRETQKVLVVVRKANLPLLREALRTTHEVNSGRDLYRIPTLEMAIAMKAPLLPMIGADPDRYMDAHDFNLMVKTNPKIDMKKLAEFSELVCGDGGRIALEKVRRVRAGEKLQI